MQKANTPLLGTRPNGLMQIYIGLDPVDTSSIELDRINKVYLGINTKL